MSHSDVYLFTRIRMQRWHVNSLGTVLCETVTMVSLSAPTTIAHIQYITDDAVHQQTWLLMLAVSPWLRVWGAAVRHLQLILRNRWVALTAQVSRSTISCTKARLTCTLLASTDRIHSKSYTNTHRPTQRSSLDKQCRSAIIISMTVICHLKYLNRWPTPIHQCSSMLWWFWCSMCTSAELYFLGVTTQANIGSCVAT